MEMGQLIHELRIKKELTLEELGNLVGVGKSTVRKWENGMIENMKRDKIAKLADALGVSPAYLMGWEDSSNMNVGHIKHGRIINVLGRVAAGIPIEAIEEIIDTEEISEEMAATGEFFGLRIKGDSMEPKISEGDTVIVRQQNDAESGDVVIAIVNGNDAVCKRLKKYAGGIMLLSNNPKYEPMVFSEEDIVNTPVKIIGRVMELRAKF